MKFKFRMVGEYETDWSFVKEKWVATYRTSLWAGTVPNNKIREVTEDMIDQLSARGAKTICLCTEELPEHILGFLMFEQTRTGEPVVHYLFVRELYRQKEYAFGRKLLEVAGIDWKEFFFYTHRTKDARKFKSARWEPSIARRKDP